MAKQWSQCGNIDKELSMDVLTLKLTGRGPLMMQADTLANPLSAMTIEHKRLTGKRKKTDDDHRSIARSEYMAALYWKDGVGVVIPGQNFDGSFRAAAALHKLRTHWDRACIVVEDFVPLLYDGPRTKQGLWEDQNFVDCRSVVVSQKRLMRYRPIFHEWAAQCTLQFDQSVLSVDEVRKVLDDAGQYTHIGTFRRRFGRFAVEVSK